MFWQKIGNSVSDRLFRDRGKSVPLNMVKDHSDSEETCCHHMGYSLRLAARGLLYAPSDRQDSTYHSLCYTSRGALGGTRNSSMGPPHEGSMTHCTMNERSYHRDTSHSKASEGTAENN